MNNVTTLQSRFIQYNHQQQEAARGMFYLYRPGRMRVEYDAPLGDYIVADGYGLYLWDDELKQESRIHLSNTIADIMLRDNLRLKGDIEIVALRKLSDADRIMISLVETENREQGELSLVFVVYPFTLEQWSVLDSQGIRTYTFLQDVKTGMTLDEDLFVFRRPEGYRWDDPQDN